MQHVRVARVASREASIFLRGILQLLRLQKRREQVEQDLPVMRQNPTRAGRLEKQARKHISGSKPNYRDMPADVSVKEPSKGSLGVVSRNRTKSSKGNL